MTDNDLARVMFDPDGRLTTQGRAMLEHWTAQEERALDRCARRWAVCLLAVDVGGLPALALLTSWAWYVVGVAWLGAVGLTLLLAVHGFEREQHRRAMRIQRRVSRLLGVRSGAAASPRHRRDPDAPSPASRITLAS